MTSMAGRTFLITGGRGSIGRVIARNARQCGANVATIDLAPHGDGQDDEDLRLPGEILHFAGDVGDPDQVATMVEMVSSRFGSVDVLINNAGVVSRKALLSESLFDWTRVLNVNLTACFITAQATAPAMIAAGWGRIINMSSIHGLVAKANMGAYCASKAAIDMLTKQLATELGATGVTVNAVAPGTIATDLNKAMHSGTDEANLAARRATLARIPQGRFGRSEDVAAAVNYLASDAAGYVTGTTLYVDGGYSANGTP